jgi:N-dimethylarginine dimethylaminohydrolase
MTPEAAAAASTSIAYGVQEMTGPLRAVLVKSPGGAFGRGFADPAHGFRWPVDLQRAQREHEAYRHLLTSLGVEVHTLDAETESPDLVYLFDPVLVTERGTIVLRSGKPTRRGEEAVVAGWLEAHGVPIVGRIVPPGTVDGGDVLRLRPDLVCVGRSLRTNAEGIRQLRQLLGLPVEAFDVPYWEGPATLVHLLSLISPIAHDLAVVYPRLLPAGLHDLLVDLGYRLLTVPDEEFASHGANVLVVRPGVCIVAAGNPQTAAALLGAGCDVYRYPAVELGLNGGGGPTCMALPLRRG